MNASIAVLMSPSLVLDMVTSAPVANASTCGLLVMSRMVPAWELAPNKVPCGPGNTSIR